MYTNSIGGHIADYLRTLPNLSVKSVGLSDPDMGLSDETITNCDVLIWWSHTKNKLVPNEKVEQIIERLRAGKLSLIVLHSALTSKVFIEAMNERTRESALKILPPGIDTKFILPKAYKDPLPTDPITPRIEIVTNWPEHTPLALVYLTHLRNHRLARGWKAVARDGHFARPPDCARCGQGIRYRSKPRSTSSLSMCRRLMSRFFARNIPRGEEFRTGMLWDVGKGKVFYFRPEHETFPGYFNTNVLRIIGNAAEWMGKPAQ